MNLIGLIILSIIKISVAIAITILVNKLSFFKSSDNSSINNNLKAKGKKMIIWGIWVQLIPLLIFIIPIYATFLTIIKNVITFLGFALVILGFVLCVISTLAKSNNSTIRLAKSNNSTIREETTKKDDITLF